MVMRMKRTLLALIVATRVLALPVGSDADQGPAADTQPGAILREDVYGAWDTCGDAPAPGQTCTVTVITAAQESGTFGTDGGMTVNRGVYDVSDTGEKQWRWDKGWYAFSVSASGFRG